MPFLGLCTSGLKKAVKACMAKDFQDAQVVIDCKDLCCQTPSSLLLRSEVFFLHKSHCTLKSLVSAAPHSVCMGDLSVSKKFWSIKDVLIASLLKPGMAFKFDKVLLVGDCVQRPDCLTKGEQMSANEVCETKSIARPRVSSVRWSCLVWSSLITESIN